VTSGALTSSIYIYHNCFLAEHHKHCMVSIIWVSMGKMSSSFHSKDKIYLLKSQFLVFQPYFIKAFCICLKEAMELSGFSADPPCTKSDPNWSN